MRISSAELDIVQRRLAENRKPKIMQDAEAAQLERNRAEFQEEPDNTPESKIQAAIREHCRLQGWFCDGSIFGVAQTNRIAVGGTDLILRTYHADYWVEVKRGKEKLTQAQQGVKAWIEKLGGKHVVARSLDEFISKVT